MTMTATLPQTVDSLVGELLTQAIDQDASDLHLVSDNRPAFRIHGRIQSSDNPPLDTTTLYDLVHAICPPSAVGRLEREGNADFALQHTVNGTSRRFRVSAFQSRGDVGCSIRVIQESIPEPTWAGFPPGLLERIAEFRNGLVLFTGVTGSGKSTSLAMLIDRMNRLGGYRMITLEEPIEYVFDPEADSIVSQREIGTDVMSFADGLKYGLRQDPDVILVGEIRDRETANLAITAAETGHLVLSTMHTKDAKGAITRLIDMVAHENKDDLRTQLALSLQCIISQHLLPSMIDGDRRVLGLEVMFNTLPVASSIRSGRIESIADAIQSGKADGMISLDQWLTDLVRSQRISLDTARRFANNPSRIQSP
jgi:twitching motility protein PilT